MGAAILEAAVRFSASSRHLHSVRPDTSPVQASLSGAGLDAELRSLSCSRGPTRRVLAALAARFISIRGWERLGFARLQDYARERLGIAARTLQDLAHTEAALSQHPQLASALVSGRLPWSKIRLVARVVGPENVSGWVSFAEGISVRALEREVRRVDRESLERAGAAGSGKRGANRAAVETDEDGAELWPGQWVIVPCARSVQSKWYHARLLARRVAGEPVPPWQCLESVAAEVLSGIPMTAEAAWRFEQDERAERATEEDVAMGLPAEEAESRTRLPAASEATHPAANVCASEGAAFGHGPTQTRGAPEHGQGRGPSDASLGGSLPEELAPLALAIELADPFSLDRRLRKVLAFEQRLEARLGSLLRGAIEAGCPRADAPTDRALRASGARSRARLPGGTDLIGAGECARPDREASPRARSHVGSPCQPRLGSPAPGRRRCRARERQLSRSAAGWRRIARRRTAYGRHSLPCTGAANVCAAHARRR